MNKIALWCLPMYAVTAWAADFLTLDPQMMEEAKGRVFNGDKAEQDLSEPSADAPAPQSVAEQWIAAMDAAGTELHPVLLLALLQRLNPDKPMVEHAEAYAAALRLHTLAAAGNKQACTELADSLVSGQLRCGLCLFVDSSLSTKWRMRAY